MPEHVTRLRTLDFIVIFILVGAIVALCLVWLSGVQGPNAPLATGNVTVHFIDVGQGDSVLVTAGDKSMLVDGGRRDAGPKLASYLKEQGITSIDVVVSTHPHADHIGGLLTILKEFPVKRVVDSGIAHPSQTYESYLTLIDRLGIPYTAAEAGQAIGMGPSVKVEVLAPPNPHIEGGVNENSVVLKVTRGSVTFLLTGDAGIPEERYLMASGYDLKSDVYKVPHHGSWYSASEPFIYRVRPEVSVIEVGPNNYGQPSQLTLAMLSSAGSVIYRTDLNGNIVVTSDGSRFTVTPQYETPSGKQLSCALATGGVRCTA